MAEFETSSRERNPDSCLLAGDTAGLHDLSRVHCVLDKFPEPPIGRLGRQALDLLQDVKDILSGVRSENIKPNRFSSILHPSPQNRTSMEVKKLPAKILRQP